MFEDIRPTLEGLEQSVKAVEKKEQGYQKILHQGVSSDTEAQKYAEILLPLYLAEHAKMEAFNPSEPILRNLELSVVRAIARQYTALKEYRLSSFYLGYAYQIINKLNLSPDELDKECNKIDTELQLQQTLYVYHTFFSPNEPLANRQLRNWCSFGRETEPYFLAPYQLLQSSLSQLSLSNTSALKEFIEKASHPEYGAKVKDNVVVPKLTSRTQRITLNEARQAAIAALENKSVEEVQKTWSEIIRACIKELCDEVKQELGEPYGWKFCLLSLGSLSRDEACLRSDIEFALLCEEIEGRAVDAQARDNIQKYFQAFVGLLELKVIALRETNELFFAEHSSAQKNQISLQLIKDRAKRGLQFDEAANYAFSTGKTLFGFLTASSSYDGLLRILHLSASITPGIKSNLLGDKAGLFSRLGLHESHPYLLTDAEHLYGDEALIEMFIHRRNDVLKETHIQNHWSYQQFLGYALGLPGSIELPKIIEDAHGKALSIKQHLQFMQWTVKSLALYYDIKEQSSIKRIQGLVKGNVLHPYIGSLLMQIIQVLFQARLKAHHHYGTENDMLYLSEQADESLFSVRQFPSGVRILKEFPTIYSYLNTLLGNWQMQVKQIALSGIQAEHGREIMQDDISYEVEVVFAVHETLLEVPALSPTEQAVMKTLLQLPEEGLYLSRETATDVAHEILTIRRNLRAMELLLTVINEIKAEHPIHTSLEIQQAFHRLLTYLGTTFKFYFKLPGINITDCFMEVIQRKHLSPELGQWLLNTLGWLGEELRVRHHKPTEEEQQHWLHLSACLRNLTQALKLHIGACTQNPSKPFQLDELMADYFNQGLVKASNPEEYANWFIDATRFLLYTQAPIAVHRHFYNKLPRDQRPFCLEQTKSALDKREPWWNRGHLFWEQLWDAPDEAGNRPSYKAKRQAWERQLEGLLCNKQDIEEEKTKVYVHSTTLGGSAHALLPEMTKALREQGWIDVHGKFTKKPEHLIARLLPGNHLVVPWPLPDGERIKTILSRKNQDEKTIRNDILKEIQTKAKFYFKIYPEYPLVELFLHDLGRRLGRFTPRFVDLWSWQSGIYHCPILVSEAVLGTSLHTVLEQQIPLTLNNQAFNESVALSAVVCLEDNKPDNLIVKQTEEGQQLVWIDADRWFVPPFKDDQLHSKDITFCLSDIHKKIDWTWREEFLSLNPEALLKAWVAFLKTQGAVCQAMFGVRIEEYFNDYTFSKRKPEEKSLLLPPLKLAAVTRLFNDIAQIQAAIAQNPNMTYFQLLATVHPRLANHQGRAHTERPTNALQRFEFVAGHAYLRGKGGRDYFSSKINFQTQRADLWQSLAQASDKPKDVRASWLRDVQFAEKELEGISETPEQLKHVKEQLIKQNNLQPFKQLSRRSKEKVLDTLDWSTLSTETQQALLKDIKTELGWEHISFQHSLNLTDDDLELIFKKSPNVKTLTLVDCPKITGTMLTSYIAAQQDFPLKAIKLENLPQLQDWGHVAGTLTFELCLTLPNLETLEVSDCANISSIHIQAKLLTKLSILDAPKLSTCRTQSEQLSYLKLEKTDNLLPKKWHPLANKDSYNSSLHTALIKPNASPISRHAELIQQFPFLLNIDFGAYHNFIYPFEIKQCTDILARYDVNKKALNTAEKQAVTALLITLLEKIKFLKQKLVKPLLKALGDKEISVRAAAAGALVKLGHENPNVIQALLSALRDVYGGISVLAAAAGALGELKQANPDVIPALLVALGITGFGTENVRAAAAGALGKLGQENPDVISVLLAALGDGNYTVRTAAAGALGKLGHENPDVIPVLLAALGDKDWKVRTAAAGALGKLGHENPDVIEGLLVALGDYDANVRAAAAGALGELKQANPDVIQALLTALRDNSDTVLRTAATGALGELKQANPDVIQALLTALGDNSDTVRTAAAGALGKLGHENTDVIPVLLVALRDNSGTVRAAAAGALGKLGHENPDVIQTLLAALRNEYSEACTGNVRDRDAYTAAAGALGELKQASPDIIEGLLATLGDENEYEYIRADVAGALGELEQANPEVIQAFLTALRDKEYDVRIAVASALVKLGHENPTVIQAFLAALKDKKQNVRALAAVALGDLASVSFKSYFAEFNVAIQTLVEEINVRLERERPASTDLPFAANPFGMFARQSINEREFGGSHIRASPRESEVLPNEPPKLETQNSASDDFESTAMKKTKR